MLGNNKLELNQYTMQTIVQEWLERTLVKCDSEVTNVTINADGNFVIFLKQKELEDLK